MVNSLCQQRKIGPAFHVNASGRGLAQSVLGGQWPERDVERIQLAARLATPASRTGSVVRQLSCSGESTPQVCVKVVKFLCTKQS